MQFASYYYQFYDIKMLKLKCNHVIDLYFDFLYLQGVPKIPFCEQFSYEKRAFSDTPGRKQKIVVEFLHLSFPI